MNLAAMERQMTHRADLDAIASMTPADRAAKRAEYQSEVDRLSREEEDLLAQLRQVDIPNRLMAESMSKMQTLGKVARQHRSAQKSLERIEKAIAKAEEAERAAYELAANIDCTAQPGQSRSKRRKQS